MELSYGLFICFLLWGGMELGSTQPLWLSQGGAHHSPAPPVLVQCLEAQLVVTVSKDLFGTGKLIRSADLTLGSESCHPVASEDTDDVIRFAVELHECGNRVQVTDDALVYRTFLVHNPRPVGNLSILRTNYAEVPIECHYPRIEANKQNWIWKPNLNFRYTVFQLQPSCQHRQGNVSSQAILPTWVPFRTTVSSEEKLVFSLHLMEEDWSSRKKAPIFQLGETAHLQAEVHTGSHRPLRLFVDHCVATATPDWTASPHHNIVDFHGCLVDGLFDSSSAFKAPRPRPDTLQFTVDVFHFANDSRNTVYITCHLKVSPVDQAPDQQNKACSFSKSSNSWSPVEGTVDICGCCNKGDCGVPDLSRKLPSIPASQKQKPAARNPRHVTEEVDVTVGPLVFLGKAADHSTQGWTSSFHTSVALGLGLAMLVALTLAAVAPRLARRRRAASHLMVCPVSASQ